MSTWLEQFTAGLDKITASRGNVTRKETPKNIAYDILASRIEGTAAPQTISKKPEGKFWDGSHWWDESTSGGSRVLDVLSRGNYASANAFESLVDNKNDGNVLSAAWAGLSGKKKTTYSDVLNRAPGGGLGNVGNGVLGFAADVLLDPTTYVGTGAIKGVAKGLMGGKELPKLGRVKNAFGTDSIFTPSKKAAKELETTGTTTTNNTNVQKLLGTLNKKSNKPPTAYKVDPVPEPARLAIEGPPKASFVTNAEGVSTYKPWQNPTARLAAETHLTSTERKAAGLLTGHESSKFDKGFTIDPLHRDVTSKVPEKYLEDVVTETPKLPTADKANKLALEIAIKGDARAAKMAPEEILGHVDRNISKMDLSKEFVRLAGHKNNIATQGKKVSIADFSKIIQTGKIPENLVGYGVNIQGKIQPIKEAVKSLKNSLDEHEFIGTSTKTTSQVEKTRLIDSVTSEKIKPVEVASWLAKYKDTVDPKDLKYILQGGSSAKNVATRIAKVTEGVSNKDFKDITELQTALKNKRLTPKAETALKYRMHLAGFKRLSDVDKAVTRARAAVLKAQESPTKTTTRVIKENPAPKPSILDDPSIVADTANIIENVLDKGKISKAFIKPKVTLAPQQAKIVEDAIKVAGQKQFIDPANRAKFGFESKTGTKRNRPTPGVGLGVNDKGFNKYSQLNIGQAIVQGASRLIRGTPKDIRPALMYDTAMPMLLAAEQQVRALGIPIILGKGSNGFPLSVHDALSALDRTFVEKYYFSGDKDFGITQFADVIEQYVRKGLGQVDDASVRVNVAELLIRPMSGKTLSPLSKSLAEGGSNAIKAATEEIDHYFTKASSKIIESLKHNSAEAAIKVGDETRALTDEAIAKFTAVITDPKFSAAQKMETALSTSKLVNEAAKARAIPVSEVSEALAKEAVAAHAASTVPMASIKTAAKGFDQFQKATNTSEYARVATKLSESAAHEVAIVMDEMKYNTLDIGITGEFDWGMSVWRAWSPHLGNESVRPIYIARNSVNQSLAKKFTSRLSMTNKLFPRKEEMAEAFKTLQMNALRVGESTPNTPAMDAMQDIIRELFSSEKASNGAKYGLLGRNGIRADHLQGKFDKFGLDAYKLNPKDLDASWLDWDIKDPLDFMSKFHAAVSATIVERELGAQIGRMFGTTKAAPDLVKIIDTTGQSKLADLLDKDLFFPKDIARQMHMLDKTLKEAAEPGNPSGFLKVLDSVTHSIKAGLTIYRPGHHARNMVGDMWLSSMDGVSASAYKRAFPVIATQKSQFVDFDAVRALEDAYKVDGKAPKSILNLKFNGKNISLSADQVYRLAFDNGVLPDYSVLEDIAFGATQQADKVAETLAKVSPLRLIGQGGKGHSVAAKASEVRDHYVRIAHFIHAMERTPLKGKTLEEALQNASFEAGSRVRKWHPDGSDLSQMERNKMRRGILFYSWVRKAIPLVLETAVTKPGRVILYPKAMQNIAAMNGIDLEGYGDPFPTDQLFPSYIADSIQGPQWGEKGSYAGVKPGVPSMDVADDYFNSPLKTLQTIMGGINPMYKIPAEVAGGSNLRTGTPIRDKTDYIDQQIPNAGYINKLVGNRSLSSGFTQPVTVAKSNEGYEGSESIPGAKKGSDFINWLSGIGLTDYSTPSSIKNAQIERRKLQKEQR